MDTPLTPDSLRPGHAVGSWLIEGYAGRGSYGLVFRARHVDAPRSEPAALKLAAWPYDSRFFREAETLSRFRHPSIPRLLHSGWWIAGSQAAHPFLVLEWIRGWPLYEWARVQRPSSRQVLRVLAQVAGALEVLHSGGCLHRDVKGDNILVEPHGRAVLTDYGSSKWRGAPPLTEALMPPNTPEYRSPEALRFLWRHGRKEQARYEVRPADDVYALGVTVYRLVTRQYPPSGTAPEELQQQFQQPPARWLPPRELNGRVVPELAAHIERMLADEPDARGSAREAAQAAEEAAAHPGPELDVPLLEPERPLDEAVPVPGRPEPRTPVWGLRTWLMVAALVLMGVGLWWMGHGSHEQHPEVFQVETPETEDAPDTGNTGLGDGGVSAWAEAPEELAPVKAVTVEMPKEPLAGQRRGPCNRGEVEIRGGCWAPWTTLTPPCGDEAYEWNGACYWPLFERKRRVPTSEDPSPRGR